MMARMTQVTDVVSTSLKSDAMSSLATTGFAKPVLVVDPDQQAWEVRTRLLIAKGYKVHRISNLADAPPRWPAHLYDLVVLATENPASPELVGFCHKLRQAHPPVRVVLLLESAGPTSLADPVISRRRPAAEIAEEIARWIESSGH